MKISITLALVATLASVSFGQGGVSHFCVPGANGSRISATGSSRLDVNGGAGDLVLHASNVPAGTPGLFVFSNAFTQPLPFGQGWTCLGGSLIRLPITTQATFALDYTDPALAGLFTTGASWNFQFWFRSAPTFDLSDGIEITFGTQELVTNVASIEQGAFSGHPLAWTGGIELVQNAADWTSLWTQHTAGLFPPPAVPNVDFSQEAVLAVFAGMISHGGVDITVRSVNLSVSTLAIGTVTTGPGLNCPVTAVITNPYHIVRFPRVPGMTIGSWTGSGLFTDCP